jgi:hypothetical protein
MAMLFLRLTILTQYFKYYHLNNFIIMADVTIQLSTINSSLQVGDTIHFLSTLTGTDSASANRKYTVNSEEPMQLGVVKSISGNNVVVTTDTTAQNPTSGDYFFFTKNNQINTSGIIGYYAEVKIENEDTSKAELFSVGTEIFQSSK